MLKGISILKYDLLMPARIVFGWGGRTEVGDLAQSLGRRAFLITGSRTLDSSGLLNEVRESLFARQIELVTLGSISHEPEVQDVDTLTAQLLSHTPAVGNSGQGDFVLAVGGGSAIDLGKAVAAMATNRTGGSVVDYLEGVGRGLQIVERPLPILAMPTTAGTGSEATKNAVIISYEGISQTPPFKKSLRSDWMVPSVVLVDPQLTVSVSPQITAYTGMDAITQLIESYISCRKQPVPRALAIEGLRLAVPAIEAAVREGNSQPAREAMSHAALLSGIALANSGLGMAHGVAAALGVHCRVPHGLACAVMLPATLRANAAVALDDLAELGRAVCQRQFSYRTAAAEAFIECIEQLCRNIGIPARLSEIGVRADQIQPIVESSRGNSMSGNPRPIADDELTSILEGLL